MSDFIRHLYRAFDTVDPEDMHDDGTMTSEAVCEVRAIDVIDAIEHIKQLEAENAKLLKVLESIDHFERASMYERCPDCDYEKYCTRETGCLIVNKCGGTKIQKIIKEAIKDE